MIDLSRYAFEALRKDEEFILYRGRSEDDPPRVLVISPAMAYPTPESLKRLEHAYSLREELDPRWAARPIVMARHWDRTVLVMEDPGGMPLDRLLDQPLNLAFSLRLAVSLSAAIGQLHQRGVIHKDIKPANVLANSDTGQCWLRGFGIASRLPRERQAPEFVAGTLAYMAPEQTGRMNRSIDSRSDLYALGVTLYEMLTGSLPFTASDPMEWVHCHVARQPIPPRERSKKIPASLSAIIIKLLAKTAEERYQTAAGVESDLRRCLAQWETERRIDEFPLGEHDTPDRILIPEKLYGRAQEIDALLASFERVLASGRPELVLVSGYSGIGKSSVVNELHKAMVAPRGLFASGKFDQYRRDIPYASLAQAFQGLVRSFLGQSEAELGRWRDALLEALGANGQLIVNLIPELELVIGKQPPVTDLPPQDAQNRFQAAFVRFLSVFARAEHPLALFLDDLQWLDTATLDLLERLVTEPDMHHLLLIGAYRDNEVSPSHPLMRTLAKIRRVGAAVEGIVLAPLSIEDVDQLVMDSLHCESHRARPLAQLIHEKTGGNPFFAIQFFSALAEEGLLAFDPVAAAWQWNIDHIQAKSYTENVVDLMAGKLRRLSATTQEALKHLACLGNLAEIATLTLVHGETEEAMHAALWEAVHAGLIFRKDTAYKFLHDRIQQAAYTLIPERRRAEVHLRIGRVLQASMTADELSEHLFDVANQFNRGDAQLVDRDEKVQVATLDLQAGRKAKASAAYASACAYFAAGMALLEERDFGRQHKLAFSLWLERAECEFLTGNFDKAEQIIVELLERAASKVDEAAAYHLKVQLHIVKGEYPQAVVSALTCLRLFGIDIPSNPTWEQVQAEYETIWRNLEGRPIERLIDLPLMTDPELLAAMRVLSAANPPAYFTDFHLCCLLRCRMVNVSMQHGTSGPSAYGCASFGFILGPVFHRYTEGYRFCRLACDFVEKHGFIVYQARMYVLMGGVALWTQPITTAIDFMRAAFLVATETGDLTHACYSMWQSIAYLLQRNDPLDVVWSESDRSLDFVRRVRFRDVEDIIVSQQRFIATMQGRTATFSTFSDDLFKEATFEAQLTDDRMPVMVFFYWIFKLKARFLSGDYAEALAAAEQAKKLLWGAFGEIMLLDYFYYAALTVAALYENASADEQPGWRELLTTHREQLREWADNYSPTFADKYALVSAEIARIEGRDLDAMELYEEAVREARKNGFVQNEGTGNELAARFYLDRGYEKIAHAYLREARYSFLRWGALGKVKQFDERYPGLAEQASVSPTTTIGTPVEQLDLGTVMKASHAVSSEIVLEKLIKTLMEIAVEHGGAERGFLILPRGEENRIEAKAKTGHGKVEVSVRQSLVTPSELPVSLLRYVIRTQESVILDDASGQNLFAEDEYVRQRRPRSVLCLPLVKQAKLMGVLYLENNLAPRVFTPKRLAMLELLTSQAAISLDHARVYADIRSHSVKLSQANEVLKRSLNALAHERQLQSVVGQVLMVLTDQIGGHSSTLWLINTEERRGYLHSVCQDGRVIAAKDSDHPKTYEWPDEDPGWYALQMKRPFVYNDPDADWQIRSPALRALFSELDTQTLVLIPLVFAEQLTGMLSVRMATKRQVAEEELEFAQALAQQATLALELTRLAEQTKQTAIVVERERAAQERAAHLAKANEALRGCLDALASVPELDDFLGQVMAVLTRHLGAVSSTLRVLNLKQNTLTLELLFQDGRVVSPSEAKFPESWRSLSLDQQRAATFLDQPMTVTSMLDPHSPIPEALRRYLLGLGVKTLLIIPLTLGGQANGQLSFRFAEECDFAPEKLEIARSLAIQASLAIHLTQLANTARHTAVLEERNQLAGEIHDSLAQFFTGIAMQLDAAKEVFKRGENDGLSYLERASELAHFGLAESRRSAFSLQPSLIEESGLIETLQKLVERSNIPGRLRCNFQSSGVAEESLPPTARHELLRIAQEAISNALRHAKPTVISVNLRCKPPNLVLEVTDNGSGIADSQAASREGFGFSNMRTRAENIGAQLKLRTTSGGGTTIAVHVPMNF